MEEIWKPVIGYEGWYEISNLGRIKRVMVGRSTRINRILKSSINKKGYAYVKLFKHKVGRCVKVNRLVASVFLRNPNNKKLVHHKNGIKNMDHADNLEWVTDRENKLYAIRDFGHYLGENNGKTKLKEFEVLEILKLTKTTNLTHASISKQYNISVQTIHNISMRRTWKHLDVMKRKEGY